ncbi:MAG: hypothetical protein QOJ25_590 [Solirubrobacteraceae bacterium]|jgi:hypothetical protein|nr:hypothetical protein [Solirubrobacteraceae bacterium]
MVAFEFASSVYLFTEDEATLLAENLRNYARRRLPRDVDLGSRLSGDPKWIDGALAVADFTEEMLVGNLCGPLPLAGKAATSTYWALRLMLGARESPRPGGMAGLRDALALELAAPGELAS